MKNKSPFLPILILFFLILSFSKRSVAQSLPPFSVQLTNGKIFTYKDVSKQRPLIIIYFAPDCEHCQKLMNEVFGKIASFKKAEILLVSFFPTNRLKNFEDQYQISKYPNITIGTEVPVFYFRNYYKLVNTPFTALFNKNGGLVISYKTQTPVDDLIEHLDALESNVKTNSVHK